MRGHFGADGIIKGSFQIGRVKRRELPRIVRQIIQHRAGIGKAALPQLPALRTGSDARLSAQRAGITLSDGRRILVEGTMALSGVMILV